MTKFYKLKNAFFVLAIFAVGMVAFLLYAPNVEAFHTTGSPLPTRPSPCYPYGSELANGGLSVNGIITDNDYHAIRDGQVSGSGQAQLRADVDEGAGSPSWY